MAPYDRHVFVCTNQREASHPRGCCANKDGASIREAVKAAVEQAGLSGTVRVNKSGCLDQCEHGVTMVVYPEGVWYGFVTLSDVEEIVRSHLKDGKPVERLRLPDTCVNTSRCPHRGGAVQLGLGGL
ncbi:MAG: (2Fe-2S) ferredoxin domain-containing protein [Planctomycetes bacterium]|nr:(2Fe-2S) ferredoxin domain-containing protein [Planctomycetota bacterium]